MPKHKDITGKVFNRLTVVEKSGVQVHGYGRSSSWLCLCECGKKVVRSAPYLRDIKNASCGCAVGSHRRTHGMTKSPEFARWVAMNQRCNNPNNTFFKNYGGRGINVCERWKSFENFYADMGPLPHQSYELDRKDNSLGYSPENCRWIGKVENLYNRRTTILVTVNGVQMNLSQASLALGIGVGTLGSRYRRGIPIDLPLQTHQARKKPAR